MDIATVKSRIEALSAPFSLHSPDEVNQRFQGVLTVMNAVYGHQSEQAETLKRTVDSIRHADPGDRSIYPIGQAVKGAIKNLKEEIESGMLGSLYKRLAGEIITDFLLLAKFTLEEGSDGAKNVASVLAAAAFEDTIRRMGYELGGVTERKKLAEIIHLLKDASILRAPQLGIAVSYLSFRNHALHADWEKIDRSSIHSILSFTEQLLLMHFQ